MKQIYMILATCLLSLSCSKNKDYEPVIGNFPKTIQLSVGEGKMRFEFDYDDQNRIREERIKAEIEGIAMTLGYRYNNAGDISEIWEDNKLWATFGYTGGILSKIGLDGAGEHPIAYSDGTYTVDGGFQFEVDNYQQLLGHADLGLRVTYANAPGIYRNLRPQPARFSTELMALTFYGLLISQQAIATIELHGNTYEVRNKTDEQGNIIQVEMAEKETGTPWQLWEITYEQRELK